MRTNFLFVAVAMLLSAIAVGGTPIVIGNGYTDSGTAAGVQVGTSQCFDGEAFTTCPLTLYEEVWTFAVSEPAQVSLAVDSEMDNLHLSHSATPNAPPVDIYPFRRDNVQHNLLLTPGTYTFRLWKEVEERCCENPPLPFDATWILALDIEPLASDDLRLPALAFATLDATTWRTGSGTGINAPEFGVSSDEEGGLYLRNRINPQVVSRDDRFGFWESASALVPLDPGEYIVTFDVEIISESVLAYPVDARVRVFPVDARYQSIGSVGRGQFALGTEIETTLPNHHTSRGKVDVLWRSDGITSWRVAIDWVGFYEYPWATITLKGVTVRRIGD